MYNIYLAINNVQNTEFGHFQNLESAIDAVEREADNRYETSMLAWYKNDEGAWEGWIIEIVSPDGRKGAKLSPYIIKEIEVL